MDCESAKNGNFGRKIRPDGSTAEKAVEEEEEELEKLTYIFRYAIKKEDCFENVKKIKFSKS